MHSKTPAIALALLVMLAGCRKQPEQKMENASINYGRIWEQIVIGDNKSFVCFSNGTCVILMSPSGDLSHQATELLKEWGPVHAGSPAGDFTVINLQDHPGWVVLSQHNDVLTYVAPSELDQSTNDIAIGLLGRSKRDQDAKDLRIVHVHDAKPKAD